VRQPSHLHPAWWQPSPLAWWFADLTVAEAWGGLTLACYTDWPTAFWITALSGLVYLSSLVARFQAH
jgi:zinc/manganese transport system permease protein